ncbi:MAG: lipopolysaccharide biosynthesis protein [Cellvibrionales bacterium]|nr:MAG: lipopolysaccharide biosynthesis protein [Cellvibrionales bacterium]
MPASFEPLTTKARAIALYLPQFHPIPENDEWWGTGFTEWTNTAKAKPLYKKHYQPHVPADLGFYDLRLPEARAAQAAMARAYGVEAFCYYHYWFGGKQLLNRPFDEVLKLGEPDFPFMLCWANESWTGVWHGSPNKLLIEQTYPGEDDHRRHFDHLLPAFLDPRYLRVDNKPVFMIYSPDNIRDVRKVTGFWRQLASDAGLPGLHLIAEHDSPDWIPEHYGFDAVVAARLPKLRRDMHWRGLFKHPLKYSRYCYQALRGLPTIHRYTDVVDSFLVSHNPDIERYPCVIPNWDNTPRSGANGLVLEGSSPALFQQHLGKAIDAASHLPNEHRLLFIKSWNEWAEGNHLEPDLRYGHGYLEAMRAELLGN